MNTLPEMYGSGKKVVESCPYTTRMDGQEPSIDIDIDIDIDVEVIRSVDEADTHRPVEEGRSTRSKRDRIEHVPLTGSKGKHQFATRTADWVCKVTEWLSSGPASEANKIEQREVTSSTKQEIGIYYAEVERQNIEQHWKRDESKFQGLSQMGNRTMYT